jgi:hypothetical protein
MRRAGYAACIVDRQDAHRVLVGKFERKGHLEDADIYVKKILKLILKKSVGTT